MKNTAYAALKSKTTGTILELHDLQFSKIPFKGKHCYSTTKTAYKYFMSLTQYSPLPRPHITRKQIQGLHKIMHIYSTQRQTSRVCNLFFNRLILQNLLALAVDYAHFN